MKWSDASWFRKAALIGAAGSLAFLVFVVLVVIFVPDETNGPIQATLPTPVPTATAEPTPGPAPTRLVFQSRPADLPTAADYVSLAKAHNAFKALDIGFLALNQHTDEWCSITRSNGDITVDLYGPPSNMQAIETDFRLTARHDAATVMGTALELMLPASDEQAGWDWLEDTIDSLSGSRAKVQEKIGRMYLTIWVIPERASMMFSVDTVRQ